MKFINVAILSIFCSSLTNALLFRNQSVDLEHFSKIRNELDQVVLEALRKEVKNFNATIADLNNVLASSGGEALEGHTDNPDAQRQQDQYIQFAQSLQAQQVFCETGFNAGHSALVFLAHSQAQVYEFDLGVHAYGKAAQVFLENKYPGRLHLTWGDSTQTLPAYARANPNFKCNFVIVDGGHSDAVAKADLVNFAKMAAPGHTLVIDDTPCTAPHCVGPKNQWDALESQGCVVATAKIQMSPGRAFTYGRYTPCPLWPNMQ